MAQNRPELHHTVPQSYLKRFARDGVITQIALSPGHSCVTAGVRSVAAEKYFHLITVPGAKAPLGLEKQIAAWEGGWNRAIEALVRDGFEGADTAAHIRSVVGFVAFQFLRTTLARQQNRELAAVLGSIMDEYGGRPEDWTDWTPNDHLRMMLEVYPEAVKTLQRRGLVLIRFQRKSLITSDNPVSLLGIPGAAPFTPLALGSNGGVYLPLSRRVGLVLREGEIVDGKQLYCDLSGSARDAQVLNQLVADRAHRYVFHHPDDDPLAYIEIPDQPKPPSLRYERLGSQGEDAFRVFVRHPEAA